MTSLSACAPTSGAAKSECGAAEIFATGENENGVGAYRQIVQIYGRIIAWVCKARRPGVAAAGRYRSEAVGQ